VSKGSVDESQRSTRTREEKSEKTLAMIFVTEKYPNVSKLTMNFDFSTFLHSFSKKF